MGDSNPLYALAVVCALFAIGPALYLERRRRQADGASTMPYKWGYYQGLGSLLFGTFMLFVGLAAGSQGALVGLLLFGVYGVGGWFVVKRRRWAWVVLTVATLNPVLWFAHYIYGRNRWHEFLREAEMRRSIPEDNSSAFASANSGLPHVSPSVRTGPGARIRRWHAGKIALMWGASLVWWILLRAMLPYGHDSVTRLVFWCVLAVPCAWVTWTWLTGREPT